MLNEKHFPSLQQRQISETYSTHNFFSEQVCKTKEAKQQLHLLNMSVGTLSDKPSGCRNYLLIELFI